MSVKVSPGKLLWLGMLVGSAVGADEVSLSRLVVQADTNSALVGVDASAVSRFCGDDDGCQIVVRLEGAAEARTLTARLFVNAGVADRWFSSSSGGAYFMDGEGAPNQVLQLVAGPNTCVMDDGDFFDPGLDNSLGFEIVVAGGPANFATCTIVISD